MCSYSRIVARHKRVTTAYQIAAAVGTHGRGRGHGPDIRVNGWSDKNRVRPAPMRNDGCDLERLAAAVAKRARKAALRQ